jgi:TctA family transporter
MMEGHMQRALLIGRGDVFIFFREPISATLLVLAAVALGLVLLPSFQKTRGVALVDED